jgi:DNA-binding FadR family transcriptional regulator
MTRSSEEEYVQDAVRSPAWRSVPKVGEQIAAVLRAEIVSGAVQDGEHLGSGTELMERFGVSRPTLREAFRILESESLISIERGTSGGVIARRPQQSHTLRAMTAVLESRGVTLSDVYEARTMIEAKAARRLAGSANRATAIDELCELIEREDAVVKDPGQFAASLVAFHERLVASSGNQTLVLLSDVLHDIVANTVARLTERDNNTPAGLKRRRASIAAQRRLIALAAAGRAVEAEDYWHDYMELVGAIMLKGEVKTVVRHADSAA